MRFPKESLDQLQQLTHIQAEVRPLQVKQGHSAQFRLEYLSIPLQAQRDREIGQRTAGIHILLRHDVLSQGQVVPFSPEIPVPPLHDLTEEIHIQSRFPQDEPPASTESR